MWLHEDCPSWNSDWHPAPRSTNWSTRWRLPRRVQHCRRRWQQRVIASGKQHHAQSPWPADWRSRQSRRSWRRCIRHLPIPRYRDRDPEHLCHSDCRRRWQPRRIRRTRRQPALHIHERRCSIPYSEPKQRRRRLPLWHRRLIRFRFCLGHGSSRNRHWGRCTNKLS